MTDWSKWAVAQSGPPDPLVAELGRLDLVKRTDIWVELVGGRTNKVWRVSGDTTAVVVKLFNEDATTPLFANCHKSEALMLKVLAHTLLAPKLLYAGQTQCGPVLVYHFVRGEMWRHDVGLPASVLRVLHRLPIVPDLHNLPTAPKTVDALKLQTRQMMDDIPRSARQELADMEPENPAISLQTNSILHGDPVPDNFICSNSTVAPAALLIDWQCPSIGDPVFDLAVFLSPAMQIITRGQPLSPLEKQQFLSVYGDADAIARLAALHPIFHWRMAAYCLWKITRATSDTAYRKAYVAEVNSLRACTV